MNSLVQSGKYGAIKTTGTATNMFYVIVFTSEVYKLQDNTTIEGQIITAGELVFKAQYLCSMQERTNWFCYQHSQHQVITVPTRTILHPKLNVTVVTDIHYTPKSVCNMTQEKSISRHPICLNDSDYDYISEEINFRDKIKFERHVEVLIENE